MYLGEFLLYVDAEIKFQSQNISMLIIFNGLQLYMLTIYT
ncbi:hypothetical protein EMIT079MI2_170080 [Bacillus sp. IT-79MI2]